MGKVLGVQEHDVKGTINAVGIVAIYKLAADIPFWMSGNLIAAAELCLNQGFAASSVAAEDLVVQRCL